MMETPRKAAKITCDTLFLACNAPNDNASLACLKARQKSIFLLQKRLFYQQFNLLKQQKVGFHRFCLNCLTKRLKSSEITNFSRLAFFFF